jgi:hypothetical protein
MFLCTKRSLTRSKEVSLSCTFLACTFLSPHLSFTWSSNSLPDFLSGRSTGFLLEIVPDSLPELLPGTLPKSLPESYLSVLPGFLPEIVLDSLPESLLGTLPESLPESYPSVLPGALPESYVDTYSIGLTQPYLIAYPAR